VKVWEVEATLETGSGQLVTSYCCANNWNNNVEFSPDSERLAINLGGGSLASAELVIWDIASGETLHTLE
jgi:hypothetical protein